MKKVKDLKVKLFADGADKASMLEMYANPLIQGLTTNPTLMKKAGITDYRAFCKDILTHVQDKPISFEVFSDDFDEMERQALEIASWGQNVYVKIPISNTKGESAVGLVKRLAAQGVKVNVTAIMTLAQVRDVVACSEPDDAELCFGFRGPNRGHRPTRASDHDRGGRASEDRPGGRADLGKPARAVQHFRGGSRRLPHHYRNAGRAEEAFAGRLRSRRLFAGYGQNVL